MLRAEFEVGEGLFLPGPVGMVDVKGGVAEDGFFQGRAVLVGERVESPSGLA